MCVVIPSGMIDKSPTITVVVTREFTKEEIEEFAKRVAEILKRESMHD